MERAKEWADVLKRAALGMLEDRAPMMGAALAYYTAFSLAPCLVIAAAAAGAVFGPSARARVFEALDLLIGRPGAEAVRVLAAGAAGRPRSGSVATLVGAATIAAGASGVFLQLQESLNLIWKAGARADAGWRTFLRRRLLSFAMVAAVGFVLLVSLFVSAALAAAGGWARGRLPGGPAAWRAADALLSWAVSGAMFAAVLKLLPDVRLSWRDVGAGGLLTAALFEAGKAVIGLYLGRSALASTYGAAGSLAALLLWVYYSAQILFFGAEFTRAWATRGGRRVLPKAGAVTVIPPSGS